MTAESWTFFGVLVTALASVFTQILINKNNRHKNEIERAVREEKLDNTLEGIKTRLDEHNNYASKLGEMKDSLLLLQQDVKYLKENKFK